MVIIGVFPAAGKLGSAVYEHLSSATSSTQIILISRHPEKTSPKVSQDPLVTIRKADYDDPTSLNDAFTGISHLLLLSYPSLEIEHRVEAHKRAINAAVKSGVSHIFYTSLAFGGDCMSSSVAHVMQAHLQTEAYLTSLAASNHPFSFTAIREGIYSESFPRYTGFPSLEKPAFIRGENVLNDVVVRIPHDGSGPGVAWAKINDLGEATAQIVRSYSEKTTSDDGSISEYRNRIVLLSGPKVYGIAETVEILATALQRSITIQDATVEEYAQNPVVQSSLGSHGHGDVPKKWATSFEAIKRGETAATSVRLEKLLGRKPESLESTITAMIEELQKA